MKLRFYNARILTMESEDIITGELWTEDEQITYVGPGKSGEENAASPHFDREIDCSGNLLMPGFKNCHTHSAMTFLRSAADDLPLSEWLNQLVFPAEAKLTPHDNYVLTKLAVLEYLSGGTTAVMDMYLSPEDIAQACIDSGMRIVQVGAVNNFSQSPELVEEYYEKLNHVSPLSSYRLGFHAEYTCSIELIRRLAALAEKFKAPFYTHISETAAEVEGCYERYKMTPVALLVREGIFAYGGAGYHLVHTTQNDIELLKEHHIGVVTNPASNMKLASGSAPVDDYLEAGLTVAIGTDGPASNNCLDMFREMFLTTALTKLRSHNAAAVPAFEVLKMATVNGAHIMGLPETDMLKPGKLADIVLLDLKQPNMQPINRIPQNVVYSGSKSNVVMTIVHGRILYERNEDVDRAFHIGEAPTDIYKQAQEIRDRILGQE